MPRTLQTGEFHWKHNVADDSLPFEQDGRLEDHAEILDRAGDISVAYAQRT
jgi:hypothetical protein